MGLEDYGVLLKAKSKKALFPGDREPGAQGVPGQQTGAGMAAALEAMGFVRQPPVVQSGPARLATASDSETRLTARHQLERGGSGGPASEYIVEALIRTHPGAAGRAEFESLSLRFAVCQPEGAGWHFLKLVKEMCEALSLAVVFGERTYSPEVFWAFRLRANEQIRNKEETWQQLFEQDSERLAIGVEDTWSHFLKKHPSLVESDEMTAAARAQALEAVESGDMEETLPPQVAKAIFARRPSGK